MCVCHPGTWCCESRQVPKRCVHNSATVFQSVLTRRSWLLYLTHRLVYLLCNKPTFTPHHHNLSCDVSLFRCWILNAATFYVMIIVLLWKSLFITPLIYEKDQSYLCVFTSGVNLHTGVNLELPSLFSSIRGNVWSTSCNWLQLVGNRLTDHIMERTQWGAAVGALSGATRHKGPLSAYCGALWQPRCCARGLTYHPYGSRWSPPCAPPTQAQPGPPGRWPPCRSGHRGGSHRCTASAWCPILRSPSSRRSHRCSIWLHSSPPWHWLSQISGLHEKRKYALCTACCGTSDLRAQIKPSSLSLLKHFHWHIYRKISSLLMLLFSKPHIRTLYLSFVSFLKTESHPKMSFYGKEQS